MNNQSHLLKRACTALVLCLAALACNKSAPWPERPAPAPITIGEYCLIEGNVVREILLAHARQMSHKDATAHFVAQVASHGEEMQADIEHWVDNIYNDPNWDALYMMPDEEHPGIGERMADFAYDTCVKVQSGHYDR